MRIVEGGVCVYKEENSFLNKSFEFSKLHSRILNWNKPFSGVRCYYFDMHSFAPGPGETIDCEIIILVRPFFRRWVMLTRVFFAWACATAEQGMCMEVHHRVCLHQNSASQSYHDRDYFVGLGECARDLTKCVVYKNTLTLPQKRSRPALTYHELLSNFISRLDLDKSTRICSACRIALTSFKSKQSDETFGDVSKHFQISLFWNGKGTQIFKKKHSKFERVSSNVKICTVDHGVLLNGLSTSFGVRGSALQWFISYLLNRS